MYDVVCRAPPPPRVRPAVSDDVQHQRHDGLPMHACMHAVDQHMHATGGAFVSVCVAYGRGNGVPCGLLSGSAVRLLVWKAGDSGAHGHPAASDTHVMPHEPLGVVSHVGHACGDTGLHRHTSGRAERDTRTGQKTFTSKQGTSTNQCMYGSAWWEIMAPNNDIEEKNAQTQQPLNPHRHSGAAPTCASGSRAVWNGKRERQVHRQGDPCGDVARSEGIKTMDA
jgi:hypothetical protein